MVTSSALQPRRFLLIAAWSACIGALATLTTHLLQTLIAILTQLAFYGRFSTDWVTPAQHHLGIWVIFIPAAGGGIIALMARFGSKMIIGHGIPEAMQQVLVNRSRITPKVAILKPLSSVISIGSGAPYGAEGPAIATGSALGSVFGQIVTASAIERKTFLAAGAAAAMTAIFGCPVAATLLSVELLLFEFRLRTFIPVAIASACAQAIRFKLGAAATLYHLAPSQTWSASAFPILIIIGVVSGFFAIAASSLVHRTESVFSKLPVSWMWHPVIGGLLVGLIGLIEPEVFGSSYNIIADLLGKNMTLSVIATICGLKFLAWVISLGSGTSGGTLAPMLIAGGGVGVLVAAVCRWLPIETISPQLAALVGMIAFFASASRALFGSILLGVEITQQAGTLWPLATASTIALLVAYVCVRDSIMTSPISLRGIRVPMEFDTDITNRITVSQVMESNPKTIDCDTPVGQLADHLTGDNSEFGYHQAILISENNGKSLVGIMTRRDILAAIARGEASQPLHTCMSKPVICTYPDELLSEALERCQAYDVGRLAVVARDNSSQILGYLGRSAILSARRIWSQEYIQPESGWLRQLFVKK